jgi:predicted transcriptional regulator
MKTAKELNEITHNVILNQAESYHSDKKYNEIINFLIDEINLRIEKAANEGNFKLKTYFPELDCKNYKNFNTTIIIRDIINKYLYLGFYAEFLGDGFLLLNWQ